MIPLLVYTELRRMNLRKQRGKKDVFLSYPHIGIKFARRIKASCIIFTWRHSLATSLHNSISAPFDGKLYIIYVYRKPWTVKTTQSGLTRPESELGKNGEMKLLRALRYCVLYHWPTCMCHLSLVTHVSAGLSSSAVCIDSTVSKFRVLPRWSKTTAVIVS